MKRGFILFSVLLAFCASVFAVEITPIPFKEDPPVIVDGDLEDWNGVPSRIVLDKAEQVVWTYGKDVQWNGPKDLSASLRVCWKPEALFIGIEVTDDFFSQEYTGSQLFLGDHLEMFVDLFPHVPGADNFQTGQFQLGFSPGDFIKHKPESVEFFPQTRELKDVICAAVKNDHGWTMEVCLPFSVLGLKNPSRGKNINLEFWLSDTDKENINAQKQIISTGRKDWKFRTRTKMRTWQLADAKAVVSKAAPSLPEIKLPDSLSLKPGEAATVTFTIPEHPGETSPVLSFKARLDQKTVSGYTQTLLLRTSDQDIKSERLLDKPLFLYSPKFDKSPMLISSLGYIVPYLPDFSSEKPGIYEDYFTPHVDLHKFAFNISGLDENGKCSISFKNAHPYIKTSLIIDHLVLSFRILPEITDKRRLPPGAPLPVCAPDDAIINYSASKAENPLEISANGQTWTMTSSFSTPDGKWATGTNSFFTHRREILHKPEGLVVRDFFKNNTGEILPIIQKHEIPVVCEKPVFLINGLTGIPHAKPSRSFNSSSFGHNGVNGIGLMPMNTEFHIHAYNYVNGNAIGLIDRETAIPPNAEICQELVIIPSKPDYWDFINRLRRLNGANISLDGPFATFSMAYQHKVFSDKQVIHRMRGKSAKYALMDTYNTIPHGSEYKKDPKQVELVTNSIARLRRLCPDIRQAIYFHSQLDSAKDLSRFAKDHVLMKNGQPATYGSPDMKIFYTTLDNETGKMFEERLQFLMDMGFDAVFWDEISHSGPRYHYGEPWDKCSADIDPDTHKLIATKSALAIIQMPWKVKMINMIRQRGLYILANGEMYGDLLKLKVPTFAETGVIENCARMQAWTPMQYGDFIRHDYTQQEMYKNMLDGLDFGLLYAWPHLSMPAVPKGIPIEKYITKTLTEYMYPSTPIEIHGGYVIAKERIITNRSGLFGWNDNSRHKVIFFGADGSIKKDAAAPVKTINGCTFSEIKLESLESAIIVRE